MEPSTSTAYRETEVLSADSLDLVRILYRAALDAVGEARRHLRAGHIRERSRQVGKAHVILTELALSVNLTQGGQLARDLVELYQYIQSLLMDANFRQVEAPLAEAETLLATLREGWLGCASTAAPSAGSPPSASVAFPPSGAALEDAHEPVQGSRYSFQG